MADHKSKKHPASPPEEAGEASPAESTEDKPADVAVPAEEKPAEAKMAKEPTEPAKKEPPIWWKVMETKRVSLGGVVTQFSSGQILNAAHYGHDGIAAIRRAGLALQPTEKPDEYP